MNINGFFDSLKPGQEISIPELVSLNQALRDNAMGVQKGGVSYPMQGVGYDSGTLTGGEYAPLVPQSLQDTLDSATFTQEDIVFWKMLAPSAVSATSPLHEWNVTTEHGSGMLDPFFAEGMVGGISEPTYERRTVRMKYLQEFIQLTDIATMTGIGGPNKSLLAQRTFDGTLQFLKNLEVSLIWGDSSLSPLHYDGLYASLKNNTLSEDMDGASLTPAKLNTMLGELISPPYYSKPTAVLCSYKQWQALVNQASIYGRSDQMTGGPRELMFYNDKLTIGTPRGKVSIIPMPFLAHREHAYTRAGGDGAPAAIVPTVALNTGPNTGSLWAAGDVGFDYYYKFEMVGDEGATPTVIVGPYTPAAAGDSATIAFADGGAPTSGTSSIRYYRAFRAKVVAGAAAPTANADFDWCGNYARNGVGAGPTTSFDDNREFKPDCSPVFIVQSTPDVIRWVRFFDYMRRPISVSRRTTQQFMLMQGGALTVGVPTKMLCLKNVSNS